MKELTRTNDLSTLIPNMKPQYRREAARFLAYAEENGFTLQSLKDFIVSLDGVYSVSTVNKYIAATKALVRQAVDSPELTSVQRFELEHGLKQIRYRKISKGEKAVRPDQILTDDELRVLIDGATERTGLIIEFLAVTGLRVSEACGVRLDRCKVNGTVAIRVLGKGQKERTVRIRRDLYDRIRAAYPGETYMFETRSGHPLHDRNVAKEIGRVGARALKKHVTPHMLRHTFATRKIRETGKVQGVSEYLGHSSTSTTLDLYVHEVLSDEDLGL